MAKIIYHPKGQPPLKKKYIPNSRYYKRLFLLSVTINILQAVTILWTLLKI